MLSNIANAFSSDPEARKTTAAALGETPGLEALSALTQLLRDENAEVRILAARSLGKQNDFRVVEPLLNAQSSEEDQLRQAASEALLQISKRHDIVTALLPRVDSENPYSRKAAVWVLGEIHDKRAFPSICKALEDKQDFVRRAAAYALGKFSNDQAVPLLVVAQKCDADPEVRQAAAASLARISGFGLGKTSLLQVAKLDLFGDRQFKHPLPPPMKDNGMLAG